MSQSCLPELHNAAGQGGVPNNYYYIIMPLRWTYWKWQAWNAQRNNPTWPTITTIYENNDLSDGHKSFGSKPTQSDVKARSKLVGYDWMLPRNKQYMVVEVKGKQSRPPRIGMVTCKHGKCLLVHFEDDWVERRDLSSVVKSEIALHPPQYQ
jgi:hypothetical protein